MAIEANGRFTPNATKAALELFSSTDMARALRKLDAGLTGDQVAMIASAYEQLFTPATVRRSESGLVRERLMKKVQDVFTSTRQAQPAASACEQLYSSVLEVRDGDWPALYVRLAVALGMHPDASECARAVIQLRREQGRRGADAVFASEQFDEMWSRSDRAALDASRDLEGVLRDVAKCCIAAGRQGAIDALRATDKREQAEARRAHGSARMRVQPARGRCGATA